MLCLLLCAVATAALPPERGLVIEIRPSKPVFSRYERITGVVVYRNTGCCEIVLPRRRLGRVEPFSEASRLAEEFRMRGSATIWPEQFRNELTLTPGQEERVEFALFTDPRTECVAGYLMREGAWRLRHGELAGLGARPTCVGAKVEVRAVPGELPGARIIEMTTRENRLLLLREHVQIDVVDVDANARLGSLKVTDDDPGFAAFKDWAALSPDGRLMAHSPNCRAPIKVVALWGAPPSFPVLPRPPELPIAADCLRPSRFAMRPGVLLATASDWMVEFDVDKGTVLGRTRTPPRATMPSPDGRYVVGLDENSWFGEKDADALLIARAGEGEVRRVEIRGYGDRFGLTGGVGAIYLTGELVPGVLRCDYESGVLQLLEGAPCRLDGESPDGKLIVVSAPAPPPEEGRPWKPTQVSVWDATSRKKLYEVPGEEYRRGAFITGPLRLVCTHWTCTDDAEWIKPRVTIHDAATGEHIRELDLAPLLAE